MPVPTPDLRRRPPRLTRGLGKPCPRSFDTQPSCLKSKYLSPSLKGGCSKEKKAKEGLAWIGGTAYELRRTSRAHEPVDLQH